MSQKLLIRSEQIFPHEDIDEKRAIELMSDIKRKQVLFKLPVVFESRKNKYIILDGHHRIAALKNLGVGAIPCLKVESQEFNLSFWIHQITNSKLLWNLLYNSPNLQILTHQKENPALLKVRDKGIDYWLYEHKSFPQEINLLVKHYVEMRCYKKVEEIDDIRGTYIIFNKVDFKQIIENKDVLFPVSSTRFILLNPEQTNVESSLIDLYRKL